MKTLIRFLFLVSVLSFSACEKDEPVNVESFMEQVQTGICWFDRYDVYFADGDVWNSEGIDGASFIDKMLFMPDGTCRMYTWFDMPWIPILYTTLEWDFEGDVLHLYDSNDKTHGKLQLLEFKNGRFVMKGYQPYGPNAPDFYCVAHGHIETDPKIIERYLSYEEYYQFREKHPELWESPPFDPSIEPEQ